VHLLFIDESGQLDQGGFFALGGIAVRDSDCIDLRGRWQGTLAAHGWPLDREIKWHEIRTGAVPPALGDALFAMLASAPVTVFVTLLDQQAGRESHPEYFGSAEDTYSTGLMFLAERFHKLLEVEDDLGLIVVDSRFREQDARLRRFFSDLTKGRHAVHAAAADHRGALPWAEPLFDRIAVRRSRRRHDGERRARARHRARVHEEADASLCRAPGDGRVRRRRHQALPGEGQARAGPAPPVLSRACARA
jgi:hypothetical protein